MKKIVLAACLNTLVLSACGSEKDAGSDLKMINGQLAKSGEFASALVYLQPDGSRCSGVKVGKRQILTAAHCLVDYDGSVEAQFQEPQAKLEISNFPTRDTRDTRLWHSGYIKSIHIIPSYVEAQKKCYDAAVEKEDVSEALDLCKDTVKKPEDIAIVSFTKDLPSQWPSAVIDTAPVKRGDVVQSVGYGCEGTKDSPIARKKWGDMEALSFVEVKSNPNFSFSPSMNEKSFYDNSAFFSAGPRFNGTSSATVVGNCPGDSGGPVFRKSNGKLVGLNKWGRHDGDLVPYFQMHSRLIKTEKPSIEQFLKDHLTDF